jgi:hypothetical protein
MGIHLNPTVVGPQSAVILFGFSKSRDSGTCGDSAVPASQYRRAGDWPTVRSAQCGSRYG